VLSSKTVAQLESGPGTGPGRRRGDRGVQSYVKYRDRICFERSERLTTSEGSEYSREPGCGDAERKGRYDRLGHGFRTVFPVQDGVEVGIREGISAVVHPRWIPIGILNPFKPATRQIGR